jgi:phospholipid/cholesterol/gamma-HCH transport system ATP-binding protein
VGLSNSSNLYPSEISGGMMKRVAIARAIALNPKYLFCDEPNSGLDPKTAQLIDELIHDITEDFKMTTIVVSHDMNSVINIGDKIVFLNEGIKEWEGSKSEVMDSKNEKLNDFVFASDLFKKIKEADEIISEEKKGD